MNISCSLPVNDLFTNLMWLIIFISHLMEKYKALLALMDNIVVEKENNLFSRMGQALLS